MKRALVALLLALVAWGLCHQALDARLALRPGAAGWRLLRGAAPKGQVGTQAGLLLPGFDRSRTAELRLLIEPGGPAAAGLDVHVDGEVLARVPVTAPRELRLSVPTAPVDALRLELVPQGGLVRVTSLELQPGERRELVWPCLAILVTLATLGLAWRTGRAWAVALALLAAGLMALVLALPFGLAVWPASWRALAPALSAVVAGGLLGAWRARRAFLGDAALVSAFAFGLALRLLFLHSTGSWDTEYWKAWMHRTMEAGATQAYGPAEAMPPGHALAQYRGEEEAWKVDWRGRRFVVDYPPLSMLMWAWSGRLVDALAPRLPAFERDNVAVKLPALLGDLLALLVLPWAWPGRRGLGLALAYWALPLSWLSSAVLGYFDGVLPALLVLALVAAGRGRAGLAGAVLAVATLIKPTAAIAAPAAALALWHARASLPRAALAGLSVAALVFLPYALDGTLVTALVHCARLFLQENLSGGFPNGWWLLGHLLTYREAHGPLGPVAFAPITLLSPLPARAIGTVLFALAAVFILRRQPPGVRPACLSGALLFLAYGMLGVGVHENHPHPLFLPMLAAGLATRRLRTLFAALSVVYLLDMLALSGIGRFHGPRYLWLQPLAEAAERLRMALGFDLTLLLTLLHVAAFVAALAWLKDEAAQLAPDRQLEEVRTHELGGTGASV